MTILHRSSFMKDMTTLFQNFFFYPILISSIRSGLSLVEPFDKSSRSTQISLGTYIGRISSIFEIFFIQNPFCFQISVPVLSQKLLLL